MIKIPAYKSPYHLNNWHADHKAHLTRGDRAADSLRNGMGSWLFVGLFIFSMCLWAIANSVPGFSHWDKYPFILLNLFLSMLAGLQGAILLIAAKRQDAIAGAMAKHDYDTNKAAKHEIERLMQVNHQQLELIEQLHAMVSELHTDVKKSQR